MSINLQSLIIGGFECSTHRRHDGRRLDMIAATRHEEFAEQDYRRLTDLGIKSARDGLRWHLIEKVPGKYDFSSVQSQIDAAERVGVTVVWDLFHYGYPDDIDIFSADFPDRFASFAAAFAWYHRSRTGRAPSVVPVNEISFYSWIAGDVGQFHPYANDRGDELKWQLVRAAIAGVRAMRSIDSRTFVISSEPAVHVRPRPEEPWFAEEAEKYRQAQFQALDILTGLLEPELGGDATLLDMIGINYYPHNQWFYPDREMIDVGDPLYRPLSEILIEVYQRYDLPILITETGTEDAQRESWFTYVTEQYKTALSRGSDLRGICLYPIMNHPGWDDERHCHNGLWDYPDDSGHRQIFEPLANQVQRALVTKSARRAAA